MPVLPSPFSLVFVVNELVIVSIERRFSRSPTKSRVSFVVLERKKSVERSMRERIGKGSSYFAASPRFNSVRFQCSLFCYQAEKNHQNVAAHLVEQTVANAFPPLSML